MAFRYNPREDLDAGEDARTLFVGWSSEDLSAEDLRQAFEAYRSIRYVKVLTNNGRSCHCGFVNFASLEEAQHALLAMDGCRVGSERVSVSVAKRRTSPRLEARERAQGWADMRKDGVGMCRNQDSRFSNNEEREGAPEWPDMRQDGAGRFRNQDARFSTNEERFRKTESWLRNECSRREENYGSSEQLDIYGVQKESVNNERQLGHNVPYARGNTNAASNVGSFQQFQLYNNPCVGYYYTPVLAVQQQDSTANNWPKPFISANGFRLPVAPETPEQSSRTSDYCSDGESTHAAAAMTPPLTPTNRRPIQAQKSVADSSKPESQDGEVRVDATSKLQVVINNHYPRLMKAIYDYVLLDTYPRDVSAWVNNTSPYELEEYIHKVANTVYLNNYSKQWKVGAANW